MPNRSFHIVDELIWPNSDSSKYPGTWRWQKDLKPSYWLVKRKISARYHGNYIIHVQHIQTISNQYILIDLIVESRLAINK